tara:strand:- start:371 stop:586 length:216 start_codon:yes stop_codon:yes gene_type:complete
MDNKDIKILEAILFASGEPLDENDLKEKIKDKNNISKLLLEIKDFYKNRGINYSKLATNGLLELLKISVMN